MDGALLFQDSDDFRVVVQVCELDGVDLQRIVLVVDDLFLVFNPFEEGTQTLCVVLV
jgi:hypothetical protein